MYLAERHRAQGITLRHFERRGLVFRMPDVERLGIRARHRDLLESALGAPVAGGVVELDVERREVAQGFQGDRLCGLKRT